MTSRNRILFYLFLALFCYTLATALTVTVATILFFVIGGIAELLFWYSLFQSNRGKTQSK